MLKPKDERRTHLSADDKLVGKVEVIDSGRYAEVTLTVHDSMTVDGKGLVHGGFTFGLADYAAMVAVNHPYVVLVSSNVKFLKPVVRGDRLLAKAQIVATEGEKRKVLCEVFNQNSERVFEGEFLCAILNRHILEIRRDRKN